MMVEMQNTERFDLDFHRDLQPQAQVKLKAWMKNSEDSVLLSPVCLSFAEFDIELVKLERELQALREKAKVEFEKPRQ